MKLLLDTHIWLWSVLAPERLSKRVRALLRSQSNELWLSSVSTWELTGLCTKKRVILDEDVNQWVKKAFSLAPLREAPLTHQIALETVNLRLPHRDPADHFLGATARVMGLTLVTADETLIKARQFAVLPNR